MPCVRIFICACVCVYVFMYIYTRHASTCAYACFLCVMVVCVQIVENKNIMGVALKEANFSLAGVYYAAGEVRLFVIHRRCNRRLTQS